MTHTWPDLSLDLKLPRRLSVDLQVVRESRPGVTRSKVGHSAANFFIIVSLAASDQTL